MRRWWSVLALVAGCDRQDPAIEMLDKGTHAVEIQIRATSRGCTVIHPNGASLPELRVPADTPVRLVMTAVDEDHEIVIGRLSKSVEPHRYSYAIFKVRDPAAKLAFECPEGVPAPFAAVPMADYETYLRTNQFPVPTTPAEKVAVGKRLFERTGCDSCHTVDGEPRVGVSMRGIWGTKVALVDGSERVVDAAFVRAAIVSPATIIRKGYPATMPSYEGMFREHELDSVVAYIASLSSP